MTETRPPVPNSPNSPNSLSANQFAGAGIQFALALVIFVFLGDWLDRRLGTSPAFILAGVVIGGGGAFFSFYRKIAAAQKRDDERRRLLRNAAGTRDSGTKLDDATTTGKIDR